MNNQKISLVVLAAGMGSRYGGLKQLDELGPNGETILEYSIFDAIQAGFGKVVFVIRRTMKNDFENILLFQETFDIQQALDAAHYVLGCYDKLSHDPVFVPLKAAGLWNKHLHNCMVFPDFCCSSSLDDTIWLSRRQSRIL